MEGYIGNYKKKAPINFTGFLFAVVVLVGVSDIFLILIWFLTLHFSSYSFSTEGGLGFSTRLAQFCHSRVPVSLETKVYAVSLVESETRKIKRTLLLSL